ncbi:S8 family serine peptidase [Actinocorallia sp. API 0066]|uniref:S8 family serine peptidase n=1 Tax=Actinocorallia sp. API 0066 TaxID=2896846 RepID=UPI001E5ACE52|nr:S8 family serine peptidase [Actinocorallia sp. API 0066]MCD0452626.1 S8 family serine peptidase [Actinocorallia sp. API 0066]
MVTVTDNQENRVHFEAVVRSESGASVFEGTAAAQASVLERLAPPDGRAADAAAELQAIGFTIRHIGTYSVSGECDRGLWESTFGTVVEPHTRALHGQPGDEADESDQVTFLSHVPDVPFTVPERLSSLVERAYPQRPPVFFGSPIPPPLPYFHLRVPDDVALILRATAVHQHGVTGRGVLVAMTDTGFYRHPFYAAHGYQYQATLAPDATRVEHDEYGHGTAEAANIFAAARDIDFVGVKMGANPVLAFKTASDLHPAVLTNSWGFHLPGLSELPNYLKPLELAVLEAVRERGITVCFSAGNGHVAFPAMLPDVIAVGGVHARPAPGGTGFDLQASDYASSFDSLIYPGRHVPDVCGLVGMRPHAIYIALPVEPGDVIDRSLSGNDQTGADDGWAVISGTSAAAPQIAGVCALLKQAQPGLSPDLVKALLKASALDVVHGTSAMGEPAGEGHDGATGAGLVDADAAYRLARSIRTRNLLDLPSPR